MTRPGLVPQLLALAVAALAAAAVSAEAQEGTAAPSPPGGGAATAAASAPQAPLLPSSDSGSVTFDDVLSAFRLGAWSGNLSLFYSGERQKISSPSSSPNFKYTRAWEALTVRNDEFYWLDPVVFSGSAGVTLGLNQSWQSLKLEQGGESLSYDQSQHGTLAGYDVRLDALRGFPYNGTVYANRMQSYTTQPFGGSSTITQQAAGTILRWGEDSILRDLYPEWLPYFSASLEAYQRKLDEKTVSLGGSYWQDQVTNGLTLDVRNGGETSDLNLLNLYVDNNDRTYAVNSFRSNDARLTYSLDFGPDLNNNWYSLLDYYDRIGAISYKAATVDQRVALAHSNDLTTRYHYLLYQQDMGAGTQLSQTGTFDLQHVLWRRLTTTATAQAGHIQTPTGSADQDYAEVRFNYDRPLPRSGRVDALVGLRYEYDYFNLASGQIGIVDEPHVAPPVLGIDTGFVLGHPRVVAASIVVVNVRGGSRLETTVNVDYSVVTQGDQTRIVVLPTSRVIQPSDPLAVSYAYTVGQDAKLDQLNWTVGAGLTYDWFGLRYQHYSVNQTPLTPGAIPIIDNVREDDVNANLNGTWDSGRANLTATYKDYNSTRLIYKSQTYQLIADYRPTPDLSVTFTGQWYRTNFTLPVEVDTASSARLDVNWFLPWGLTSNAYAFRGRLKSTLIPDNTVSLLGLKLTYNWRKITLTGTVQTSQETRGSVKTNDNQVLFSLVRQI